jgi:predicted dehydrogenase
MSRIDSCGFSIAVQHLPFSSINTMCNLVNNHSRLYMKNYLLLFLFCCQLSTLRATEQPLRIGVVGLTHTHVHWILGRENKTDITIVGIVEPNRALAERYAKQHGFSMKLVYNTMEEMIEVCKPEAVAAFGTIYEHLKVVQIAAPKGIHVMVEKPLAVSLDHAQQMAALAKKHHIHLLTNYETSWYPSNHKSYELLHNNRIGSLRKLVVHDGHRGPKKIGINSEFLDWLTDPVQNGGGALMDFGCYGANLATWLLKGKRPTSVTAVTQQLQPENNPLVDDEATIIVTYPDAQVIIQASWNWPIGRKDMELYGLTGVLYSDNRSNLRMRDAKGYDDFTEEAMQLPELKKPYHDPFAFFAAVVQAKLTPQVYDLSSLENNLLVMEILEAARKSAIMKRTVEL